MMGSETILFVGGHYEIANPGSGQTVTKYYFAGASRIAMRKYTIPQSMTVEYMLGDHLGSTSITTDSSGNKVSEMRYKAWGEVRYSWTAGASTTPAYSLMDYTFTGQFSYASDFGLLFYNARWYDPYLNHFTQPDSIVPDPANPQAWDRYAYTNNNPIRYNDPSGHRAECSDGPQTWAACKEQLEDFANITVKNLGGKDDLEALVRIVDKAAQLYGNYDEMIPALSGIFLGLEESNSITVYNAATGADPCAAVGRSVDDCAANAGTGSFGDAGFHRDFRDGFSQPFHFWAYLATAANTEGEGPASYLPGRIVSIAANIAHEMIWPDGAGATWQDYALARAGMNIGTLVNVGAVPPDQLGNTIREYVGAGGPGAFYVNPLKIIAPLEGNR